jgi:hypothetical protein
MVTEEIVTVDLGRRAFDVAAIRSASLDIWYLQLSYEHRSMRAGYSSRANPFLKGNLKGEAWNKKSMHKQYVITAHTAM